jgi:23S rRNA (cytosine1962-C5)-methyltransferase
MRVCGPDGEFIGKGYFNPDSAIALRMLTWDEATEINEDFWRARIAAAIALRRETLQMDRRASAYRLVFSEGDGLPGLIVDKYGDYLGVQFLTLGIAAVRETILDILEKLCSPAGIYERAEETFQEVEGGAGGNRLARGKEPPDLVEIAEYGIKFAVDIKRGQKTGFYLDQRENRSAFAQYIQGGPVLDCFCHTAAFGVYSAVVGKANRVVALDTSERALELAKRNTELNGVKGLETIRGDAFQELRRLREAQEQFDAIVLDPPKFAKSRAGLAGAMKGYKDLNLVAMQIIKKDGILATCSCSQHVDEDSFVRVLNEAAHDVNRTLQILEHRTQGLDHPVMASCVETKYLKCLICRVL